MLSLLSTASHVSIPHALMNSVCLNVWCCLRDVSFPVSCPIQEVMCEGCRFGSHKQHNHDFVAHVAANERSRMKDIGQRTRALSSALQGRIDALNASSKKCTNSAHGVKQEIKRQFDRIRAALLEREEALSSSVGELLEVTCRSSLF